MDVLVTMRLDPGFGYLIVADYLRGTLYVMIPPGSGGDAFDGMPGVRVLGRHHQLLMPRTVQHHSALADWVGVPDATSSALADPHQLAGCLRELAAGQERAAAA
ncbi:hypothetical protein PV664_34025 [Streptomyces sp. ME01-18a]|uniref:hypothetical protein n=1 Tax=Streptomyces sp. ME01-18a TaxID=3028669 RepID=UPI0029B600BA|nr:hypothetical protein [Streptomyces sp. ME01-18a]MDX3433903.1 hypothetical protein [Streptomyces sp. ME01-18a]